MANSEAEIAEAPGTLVLLQAGVGIELGEGLAGGDMAKCKAQIGFMYSFAGDELIGVSGVDGAGRRGAGADAWVVGEEGLAETERKYGNEPGIFGEERDSGFGGVDADPGVERVVRKEEVDVVDIDFVATPAEVVTEVASERALDCDVRSKGRDGDVVGVNGSERAVIAEIAGIEEIVVVEIVATRSFAVVFEAEEKGKGVGNFVDVVGGGSGDGAKFTLANESLTEIGEERKIVGAQESGELELLVGGELPVVVEGEKRGVRLIFLAWVDGVAVIGEVSVGGVGGKDGNQTGDVGKTIVSDAEESDLMIARMEKTFTVELILLPMLQTVEKAVAVRTRDS